MSKFVDEIIDDIKTNPKRWISVNGDGLSDGKFWIKGYGNTAILSCIDVVVNGHRVVISYCDRYRLEKTITWWYRQACIVDLLKTISV